MPRSHLNPAQHSLRERYAAIEEARSAAYAEQASLVAAMSETWDEEADLILDLAGTARAGQIRSGGLLDRSIQLVRRMPVAHALLAAGEMRVATVEILLAITRNATHEVQEVVDARVSEKIASLDAVDAGRLVRTTLPEVEAEVDEAAQRDRLQEAVRRRGVSIRPGDDAMARVTADLPAVDARRWALDFEELVRAQKVLDDRNGVVRTGMQRRADVFRALPSQLLALAEAGGKGKLDALLAQAMVRRQVRGAKAAATARSTASDGTPVSNGAGVEVAMGSEPDGQGELVLAGQGELELDLPPAAPPAWWQRDRDDLLLDLLSLPVRKPAVMNLHVGMTTCLDLDQRSGYLEGFGPVPALHARMLLPTAGLRRVGVDERTGIPLGLDPAGGPVLTPWDYELDDLPGERRHRGDPAPCDDDPPPDLAERVRAALLTMLGPMYLNDMAEPQHDPSAALRTLTEVRDQLCDGPGCPRHVRQCELDHEDDYADGGQTAVWNLKHRSTRCHHRKHDGWDVEHDHDTGVTTWVSPSGGSYERRSVWQPPTAVPEDVELPAPRVEPPLGRVREEYPDTVELPLWPEPRKPSARPRTVEAKDVDRLRPDGTFGPPPPRWFLPDLREGWDDGPPPF